MYKKACILVMDSVGIGALPDAALFGDQGSDTLGGIIKRFGDLKIPHLLRLGIANIDGVSFAHLKQKDVIGSYGRAIEKFAGKDTTGGHWEIAGLQLEKPFPTYPHGFPKEVLEPFMARTGRGILGNCVASGTEIIARLGEEHLKTGKLIVYTSADSVFQIAMHEEIIPLEEQIHIGKTAREILQGDHPVGRVIIRPFVGEAGSFKRTTNRRDFSLPPTGPTILDAVFQAGMEVAAVGKIEDIFNFRGITRSNHTPSNDEGIKATIAYLKEPFSGLVFTNLVDFDTLYGHRNDIEGYARAIEAFDMQIPAILNALGDEDLLIITSDHGCDPSTTQSTDHSREYIPLLAVGKSVRAGINLGTRETFSDIAATVIDWLGLAPWPVGASFIRDIKR
ncbi:MAG: phosphopentomutase [Bacillota bacterium]